MMLTEGLLLNAGHSLSLGHSFFYSPHVSRLSSHRPCSEVLEIQGQQYNFDWQGASEVTIMRTYEVSLL